MAPFWFLNHGCDLCVRCGHLVGNNQAHSCVCRWPLRVGRDTRWYICWKDLFDNPAPTAVHPVCFWKPGASSPLASLAAQGERFSHEHVGAVMPPVSRTPSPCFDWEPPRDAEAAGSQRPQARLWLPFSKAPCKMSSKNKVCQAFLPRLFHA